MISYVQGLSAVPDTIVRASSVGTVCGMGPSPDRICDVRRMKPNMYPEGMKRDYCSYNEAFWESRTGSQAGLKMNQESRSRNHGSAVTFVCVAGWPGLKFPPAPKEGAPGLAYSSLRFET